MQDPELQPESLCISLMPLKIRFQLIHILYAIALTASGLAVFGAGGVLASLIVLAAWTYIFSRSSRLAALAFVLGLALPLCCCSGLLLRARSPAREAARRTHCVISLKNIAIALQNYHDDHGSFPPAFIADQNGREEKGSGVFSQRRKGVGSLFSESGYMTPPMEREQKGARQRSGGSLMSCS